MWGMVRVLLARGCGGMRQLVVTAKGRRLLRCQRRTLRVAFAADPLPPRVRGCRRGSARLELEEADVFGL